MMNPESGEGRAPEQLSHEELTRFLWLVMAESDHALGRREIFAAPRERLDPAQYGLPGDPRVRGAMRYEIQRGTVEPLAFRGDCHRLTPRGLKELERANPTYQRKVVEAAGDLVRLAAERVQDRRHRPRETQVRFDTTLAGGVSVSWTNFTAGLSRLEGAGLMESERALLPDGFRKYGSFFQLVEQRFEFGDLEAGHAEETLVLDYCQDDEDRGRRLYRGEPVPNLQVEVHRDRVALGVLHRLTAELRGHSQGGIAHLRTD